MSPRSERTASRAEDLSPAALHRQSPPHAAARRPRAPAETGRPGSAGQNLELECAYELDPLVSVRSEHFGALLYHGRSRRLVFVRVKGLADELARIGEHASVASLLAGLPEGERSRARAALAALVEAAFLRRRGEEVR